MINSIYSTPFKEGGPDVEIMVKQYGEYLKMIKNQAYLSMFNLTKVAKVEAMIDMCNHQLPKYLDIMTKMK